MHTIQKKQEWDIKRYYDAISKFKINIPTPVMAGVRTPLRQFASCVLVDVDDTLDSFYSIHGILGRYIAQRSNALELTQVEYVELIRIRGGEVAPQVLSHLKSLKQQ